jgi:diadenosine tetraphosphate (Ap4A) HIT family hydrolase
MFAGFEVPYAHYHLIPTDSQEDLHFKKTEQAPTQELTSLKQAILTLL